jgi:transcription initiation factor TFIIB
MSNASLKQKVGKCSACGSTMLEEFVEGQIICCNCGRLIGSNIEDGYTENTNKPHPKMDDCSTVIPLESEGEFSEWQRLLRVSDSTERNTALILYYITKIVRELWLPWFVVEESINIHKALAGRCNFKGKRLKAISAAIVYASCKITGVPCSLRKVAKASEENPQKVFHSYSFIVESLKIPQAQLSISKLLNQTCKMMKTDVLSRNIARNIINVMGENRNLQGKNPYGHIAAAIYIASILARKERTQREIADITHVTEATIRTRYKEIMQNLLFTIYI